MPVQIWNNQWLLGAWDQSRSEDFVALAKQLVSFYLFQKNATLEGQIAALLEPETLEGDNRCVCSLYRNISEYSSTGIYVPDVRAFKTQLVTLSFETSLLCCIFLCFVSFMISRLWSARNQSIMYLFQLVLTWTDFLDPPTAVDPRPEHEVAICMNYAAFCCTKDQAPIVAITKPRFLTLCMDLCRFHRQANTRTGLSPGFNLTMKL